MIRRILPTVLLLLAVGLVAWLVLRGWGGSPAATPATPPAAAEAASAQDTALIARQPQPSNDQAREAVMAVGEPSAPSPAVLLVRVVALEGGRPLADVPLQVSNEDDPAANRRYGRTDERGLAEIEVPTGGELKVEVAPGLGTHGGGESRHPALDAGDRGQVEVAVPTQPDQVFFGRLVDAESGEPVFPALLHREFLGEFSGGSHPGHERGPGVAPVGPDGRFRIDIRTWDFVLLCVHAPGWSLATVQLTGGHDTPERERRIEVVRAGVLRVDVIDAGGRGLEGVLVRATVNGYDLQRRLASTPLFGSYDPWWEAPTGSDGRVLLAGIPARASLTLTASPGDGEPARTVELEPLEPGEQRDVQLRLGGGARVDGQVVDPDGRPVPDVEVWLVEGHRDAYLHPEFEEPRGRATSDAQGRFTFDDVQPGAWSVGVAPQSEGVTPEQRLASLRTPFEVGEGDGAVSVRVVAHRGLTIEGAVLDPSGAGVEGVAVFASSVVPWGRFDARTDPEGRFRIAGLVPGELELSARELGRTPRYAPGPSVTARAGQRGVVLRVETAAALSGRLVAPPGAQLGFASLWVSRSDGASPLQDLTMRGLGEPSFEVGGLPAGVWGLGVTTAEGLVGVLGGLALSPGQRREDLVVRLEPGAELRVTTAQDSELTGGAISVHAGGACLGFKGLQPGGTASFRVPGGRVSVLASSSGEIAREIEVEILPGEVREIVLD